MTNVRSITVLSLVLLNAFTALAAEKDAAAAGGSVDAVLEKYVKAVGGKEALSKVESRSIKADLVLAGSTSDWTLIAKAPNKRFSHVDVPDIGVFEEGCDGDTSWTKTQGGIQTRQGDELAHAKAEADFRRELRMKELYPGLEAKGTERFNGEEVQVLEAKPSATSKERFSFSTKTGLLVRQQSDFVNNDGTPVTVEAEFSDHRDVDGIKYAHTQKIAILANGQPLLDFTLKVKEIKHNEKVDDVKFKKPT